MLTTQEKPRTLPTVVLRLVALLGASPAARRRIASGPVREPGRRRKVFLCHGSGDKAAVRQLHRRLIADGFDPWLDEEELLPGQDWDREIRRAIGASDLILVCLSTTTVHKTGYVQKELRHALDVAGAQPDGAVFIVPVRIDDCVVPQDLSRLHYVDLFAEGGYARLVRGLQ